MPSVAPTAAPKVTDPTTSAQETLISVPTKPGAFLFQGEKLKPNGLSISFDGNSVKVAANKAPIAEATAVENHQLIIRYLSATRASGNPIASDRMTIRRPYPMKM